MTTRNNFDQSSTGLNVECTCFYDTDRSERDFRENFEVLQHSGYRTSSVLYYIDNGNVPGHDEIKFIVKGDKAAKIKFLEKECSFEAEEISSWDDDTIDTEILGNLEDLNLINYAEKKHFPVVDGLEFVPNKNLIVISSRGYSQGDYSTVIYCPEDIEKAWGNAPDQNDIQKMVDHYLWDAPIYAQITLNENEFNIWDMDHHDDYTWDREKFVEWGAKKSGIDREKFQAYVPANPSYD